MKINPEKFLNKNYPTIFYPHDIMQIAIYMSLYKCHDFFYHNSNVKVNGDHVNGQLIIKWSVFVTLVAVFIYALQEKKNLKY